jgi:acetoacetyl-CoA synthetase
MIDMIQDDDMAWRKSETLSPLLMSWDDFLKQGSLEDGTAPPSVFTPVPFAHPQFVLYSSGTTGMPKSIAHGAGNVLLQHAKELLLHSDLRPKDRMLFYTTCGWMMWNWMTSSLYAGATVVCFDGFAAHPRLSSPWDLIAKEGITHMGTTPRYLQACRRRIRPDRDNDLSALRVVLSTGSPLAPEDFEYVYEHVKKDVLLASISGGTDICSCFALGNPLSPVRKSELQAFGLGLDVCAYDVDEKRAVVGAKAELVCRSPFVAAPVGFFGDDEKKSKYRGAYFRDNDPGTWYHGDLVEVTGSVGDAGGLIIHGRSDTTLKPGGIRIGTAEVYRFAEEVERVQDSLVIGDQIKSGKRAGDVRIVLFVQLVNGAVLTPEIEDEIRSTIRSGASDAHVPALIRQVQKIPYTKSGKKVEIAVRDLFADGTEPKNVGALIDPSAFDEYRKMALEGL